MAFRDRVLECLGEFPQRCAVKAEVVHSVDKGTHTLQKIRYNVEENERIEAYLLLPKKLETKNPAIIAAHQHGDEFYIGKSEVAGLSKNAMYHYGLELCLRGYVVLCPDHLGFENRRPEEFIRKENNHLDGSNYEQFLFTTRLLKGSTLQAKYISDLCRGIDALESLEYVDKERIGAIGHSLGGQETLWLTWYDPRIKVAVSSCGFSLLNAIIRDGINHNRAMYSFGFLKAGDMDDLVADLAPRPFMMTNGAEDPIFPVDGVRAIAEKAQRSYALRGSASNFKSLIFPGPHAFPEPVRLEAYQWLDRVLKGK